MELNIDNIFFWGRILLVCLLPLAIVRIRKVKPNLPFKLYDLSKVLVAILFYYVLMQGVESVFPLGNYQKYWLNIIGRAILSSFFIIAVAKFSNNYQLLKKTFKIINKIPVKSFIVFALYVAAITYLGLTYRSSLVLENSLLGTLGILKSPWWLLLLSIIIEIYIVVGEELIFRYFAINSLRNSFKRNFVIVLSSLIWLLMHKTIYFNLFVLGFFLAYVYLVTDSLLPCIVMHFLWNFIISLNPVYLYFRSQNVVTFTPFQYSCAIFVLIISIGYLSLYLPLKGKRAESLI